MISSVTILNDLFRLVIIPFCVNIALIWLIYGIKYAIIDRNSYRKMYEVNTNGLQNMV